MEKYDYEQAVREDIKEYIRENCGSAAELERIISEDYAGDSDRFLEFLEEDLWSVDSVTGNASGSYWFSSWKAEEALAHNSDLLIEALEEFGYAAEGFGEVFLRKGAEWADVAIRCWLMPMVLPEAVAEYLYC